MKPVKLLLSAALIAWAGVAQSAPIFTNAAVSIYQDKATFPTGLTEQEIFLVDTPKGGALTGYGTVGFNGTCGSSGPAPCVNFTSTSLIDLSNGNATIKPAGTDPYHDLTITVPGFQFGDFLFDAQLDNTKETPDGLDLKISAFFGATLLGSITLGDSALDHDTLMNFLVLGGNSTITKIVLESNSGMLGIFGFKETKHFDISELTALCEDCSPDPQLHTPIPGAIWLFGGGLGLVAMLSGRRKRKQKSVWEVTQNA